MSAPKLVQLGRGSQARAEPPVRADRLLDRAERGVLHVDRLLQKVLPFSFWRAGGRRKAPADGRSA